MDKIEFAGLTDEAIKELSTADLRELAEDQLESWARAQAEVANFKITNEVLATPGLLAALEPVIALLRTAYADRGPRFEHDYGSIKLTVWHDDDLLRRRLRGKRDELVTELAEQINS